MMNTCNPINTQVYNLKMFKEASTFSFGIWIIKKVLLYYQKS
jgi:hypothetical protein